MSGGGSQSGGACSLVTPARPLSTWSLQPPCGPELQTPQAFNLNEQGCYTLIQFA